MTVAGVEPMIVDNNRDDNENTCPSATTSTSTAGIKPPADISRGEPNGQELEEDPSQRWRALEKLVSRPSPFGAETGQLAVGEFEPFENVRGCSEAALPRCRTLGVFSCLEHEAQHP